MNKNPYSPPTTLPAENDVSVWSDTRIPKRLLRRTRQSLALMGLSMILLPLLAAFFTDRFRFNLLGFFVLVVAVEIHPRSFRRFPRTLLLCGFTVCRFFFLANAMDWTEVSNWLPHRGSPVLLISLVSSALSIWAGWNVWKCHRHHKTPVPPLIDDGLVE